jgi:hypothetical protein
MKPVLCAYCELVEVRLFPDKNRRGVMVVPQPSQFVPGDQYQQNAWVLKVRRRTDGRREGFVVPVHELSEREQAQLTHVLIEHQCANRYRALVAERDNAVKVGDITASDIARWREGKTTRRRPG